MRLPVSPPRHSEWTSITRGRREAWTARDGVATIHRFALAAGALRFDHRSRTFILAPPQVADPATSVVAIPTPSARQTTTDRVPSFCKRHQGHPATGRYPVRRVGQTPVSATRDTQRPVASLPSSGRYPVRRVGYSAVSDTEDTQRPGAILLSVDPGTHSDRSLDLCKKKLYIVSGTRVSAVLATTSLQAIF